MLFLFVSSSHDSIGEKKSRSDETVSFSAGEWLGINEALATVTAVGQVAVWQVAGGQTGRRPLRSCVLDARASVSQSSQS